MKLKSKILFPLYYLDRELWRLEPGRPPLRVADETAVPDVPACRVLILAKEHYHETKRAFPFVNPREIREAVALDPTEYSPFVPEFFALRRLASAGDGCLVNLWFVRPTVGRVIENCNPWLVIPETAFAPLTLPPGLYRVSRPDSSLLLQVGMDQGVTSMAVGPDPAQADLFRRGLGRAGADGAFRELENYPASLAAALPTLSAAALRPFFRAAFRPLVFSDPALYRTLAVTSIILLLAVVGWFVLPEFARYRLAAADHALDEAVGHVLERQQELNSAGERYARLRAPLLGYVPKLSLLNMLHRILPLGVRISRLNATGNEVEMQGTAVSGAAVLAALAAAPEVRESALVAPLRREAKSDRDLFTIRFIYLPTGAKDELP